MQNVLVDDRRIWVDLLVDTFTLFLTEPKHSLPLARSPSLG